MRTDKDHITLSFLKVDSDLPFYLADTLQQRTRILLDWLGVEYTQIVVKPSTHEKVHLWVHLKEPLPISLAFLYQLLLGDDVRRYRFNEFRLAMRHAEKFNLLFSRKMKR